MRSKVEAGVFHNIWPSVFGGIQGRLYAEMRTNPFAEKELANCYSLPIEDQFQAVINALKVEPNYIGSAIALLIKARQKGFLDSHVNPLTKLGSEIPRTILQYWDSEIVPEDIAKTMHSWCSLNPNFQHIVFNDISAEIFLKEHFNSDVLKAFRISNHAAMRADLFRLAYLLKFGGVYADADDLCRYSIDSWFESYVEILLIQEHLGTIGNNFMAVIPGHPFIQFIFDRVVNQILNKQGDIWFASGPGAMTVAFSYYYLDFLSKESLPEGVEVKTCYELETKISMRLPRQYKQTNKSWSSPKNNNLPIYCYPRSFISVQNETKKNLDAS
jgi:mannosyltransferase OCH1-like enzyme